MRSPQPRRIRAAVQWSYRLLDAPEQEAFARLAVFVGGFDAEAARAVAPGLSLDLLARLVDRSLATAAGSARGRTRYRLLETVRDHAAESLVGCGELDAARERHFRHFAAFGPATEPGLPSPRVHVHAHDLRRTRRRGPRSSDPVRTVESHVRHSLTKLGLANRTQLAAWARERLGRPASRFESGARHRRRSAEAAIPSARRVPAGRE